MNIEIQPNLNSLKRKNKVYWSFKWKKYLNDLRILFFISLFGILGSLQSILLQDTLYHPNNFNQNSILVFLIICFLIKLFCIRNYMNYRKQKESFDSKIYELANNIGTQKIKITNDKILFENNLSQNFIDWKFIKCYKIVDNCLFLSNFKDDKNFKFQIDLEMLNHDDRRELLDFLQKKLH